MRYRVLKRRWANQKWYYPQGQRTFLGIPFGKWKNISDSPFHYPNAALGYISGKGISLKGIEIVDE